ncbi:type II toxin-antitoxin system RelE/ParE family toxin [Galbibacter sp. PAP.153]|uniref:type II toxin-antitoxin system RelE/ParE family toxin n=1 Tax=Galbibacter sp. PAP.153 TaxID=3104623 RepID=UPI00300BE0E5
MNIKWSNRAVADNLENISFLFDEWGLDVVLNYEKKIIQVEELLLKHPNAGVYIESIGYRKIAVAKQISILYDIAGSTVLIVRLE